MNNINEAVLKRKTGQSKHSKYQFDNDFYRANKEIFRKLLFKTSRNHKINISTLKRSLVFPMFSSCEAACFDFTYNLLAASMVEGLKYKVKCKNNFFINSQKSLMAKKHIQNIPVEMIESQWPVLKFKNSSSVNIFSPMFLRSLNNNRIRKT
jgi:hypothetical protein